MVEMKPFWAVINGEGYTVRAHHIKSELKTMQSVKSQWGDKKPYRTSQVIELTPEIAAMRENVAAVKEHIRSQLKACHEAGDFDSKQDVIEVLEYILVLISIDRTTPTPPQATCARDDVLKEAITACDAARAEARELLGSGQSLAFSIAGITACQDKIRALKTQPPQATEQA